MKREEAIAIAGVLKRRLERLPPRTTFQLPDSVTVPPSSVNVDILPLVTAVEAVGERIVAAIADVGELIIAELAKRTPSKAKRVRFEVNGDGELTGASVEEKS